MPGKPDTVDEILKLQGCTRTQPDEYLRARKYVQRLMCEGKQRWAQAQQNGFAAPPKSKIARQMQARETEAEKFIVAVYASVPSKLRPPDFEQLVINNVRAIVFDVPSGDRPMRLYRHLVKPWKGRAGRNAAAQRGNETRAKVLVLHQAGMSTARIAKLLEISPRRVQQVLETASSK